MVQCSSVREHVLLTCAGLACTGICVALFVANGVQAGDWSTLYVIVPGTLDNVTRCIEASCAGSALYFSCTGASLAVVVSYVYENQSYTRKKEYSDSRFGMESVECY